MRLRSNLWILALPLTWLCLGSVYGVPKTSFLLILLCLLGFCWLFYCRAALVQLSREVWLRYRGREFYRGTIRCPYYVPGMRGLVRLLDEAFRSYQEQIDRVGTRHEALNFQVRAISHDMRTPLTSVLGYLELAASEADSGKRTKYMETARERAKLLQKLVEDFYELTCLEQGGGVEEATESLDLRTFVEQQLLLHYEAFRERGIDFRLDLPHEAWIQVSRYDLERVIGNLLANMLRYCEADTEAELSLYEGWRESTRVVELRFSNQIRQGLDFDVEQIFDRFYTGDRARQQRGRNLSSGLGLYICRELSARNQGQIWARRVGTNLDIHLTFPLQRKRQEGPDFRG